METFIPQLIQYFRFCEEIILFKTMQTYLIRIFLLLLLTREALATPNTISLELNHVEISSVLQLLADRAHLNLVLADDIQGSVSLHLNNVNWDEALNLVLKTKGLAKQQTGKTLWIAKASEIMDRDKQNCQLHQQADDFAPLINRAIPLRYANAKDVLTMLKEKESGMLSSRGHILADERTHLIWLSDTPKQVHEIQKFIQYLDIPLKQIMIEARIINVDRSFEKNLGVHFALPKSAENDDAGKASDKKTAFQLASSIKMKGIGSAPLGMFVTKLAEGVLLDVELSALANEGKGEFISNPKLMTQDQKTAFIQAGEEIPFQEKTRGGGSCLTFKKAVLSLEVTPRILPHKQLLLDLKVNQDAPGVSTNHEVPMIDTRQIETHVQVQSGQTLVLGGILESNKQHQASEVPFLSKIPLLGYLFQEHNRAREQRELLVFITPTIVDGEIPALQGVNRRF